MSHRGIVHLNGHAGSSSLTATPSLFQSLSPKIWAQQRRQGVHGTVLVLAMSARVQNKELLSVAQRAAEAGAKARPACDMLYHAACALCIAGPQQLFQTDTAAAHSCRSCWPTLTRPGASSLKAPLTSSPTQTPQARRPSCRRVFHTNTCVWVFVHIWVM